MNKPKVSFVGLNLWGDIKELDDEKVFEFTRKYYINQSKSIH